MWSDKQQHEIFFCEATLSELRQLFTMFFLLLHCRYQSREGKRFQAFLAHPGLFSCWLQPGLPFSQQLLWDHCLPTRKEQPPYSRINLQSDSTDNHPNQDITRNALGGCSYWACPIPWVPFCVTTGQSRDFCTESPKYCIYYLDIPALSLFYLCAF